MTRLKIGIIDADLIGRKKHSFPNLASMKLSSYHKNNGDDVTLLTSYDDLNTYDKVYISKVFTDTTVPDGILDMANVECGGTGFLFDKAQPLPDAVEHSKPDYHLYDKWVDAKISDGGKPIDYKYYTDYSIGFLTRGCFRHCEFCVNQNYNKVEIHSPLAEFLDESRPKICLLDDNVFGCQHWESLFEELRATGKPFQFRQGLDERILTDRKCELLFSSRYDGEYFFAFDNIADKKIIVEKIKLIRKYTSKRIKFYVLCAFDRDDRYDDEFWIQDLYDLFERIEILMQYDCMPYVMRFEKYETSPYRGTYINLARWCNQYNMFKTKSYREFCDLVDSQAVKIRHTSACWKYFKKAEEEIPDLAERYFDIKADEVVI